MYLGRPITPPYILLACHIKVHSGCREQIAKLTVSRETNIFVFDMGNKLIVQQVNGCHLFLDDMGPARKLDVTKNCSLQQGRTSINNFFPFTSFD